MPPSIEEMVAAVMDAGLAAPGELAGCTEDQISQMEATFGLALPKKYREYLSVMGANSGDLFIGTDIDYPWPTKLRKAAERLCLDSPYTLPADAFVFSMHQGYSFLFIEAGQGDDPPVFLFSEGYSQPTKVAPSFSGWLLNAIRQWMEDAK